MKLKHPFILATLLAVSLLPAQTFATKPIKPPPPSVAKVYAGDVLLGYTSLHKIDQGEQLFLYEPTSGHFITLKNTTGNGTSTYSLLSSDIKYETFDCTGQGIVYGGGASGTANVLIANGASFYRTMGSTIDPRPIIINSVKDKVAEACSISSDSISNDGLSLVEPIANPLPYSLPFTVPAFSIRMEYAAP